jgi:hypothetical protein
MTFPAVMAAQGHPAASRGGDPVFAGIHVFAVLQQAGRDKQGHDLGEAVQYDRNAFYSDSFG